jgi:hypothetical protein
MSKRAITKKKRSRARLKNKHKVRSCRCRVQHLVLKVTTLVKLSVAAPPGQINECVRAYAVANYRM